MSSDYTEYIKEEFGKHLVGRTITEVRELKPEELEQFDWHDGRSAPAIVAWLDNGGFFIPAMDPELNGPGYLLVEPPEDVVR